MSKPEQVNILSIQSHTDVDPNGKFFRRVLGLGDDNNLYLWHWHSGEWRPYMSLPAQEEKGLYEVREVDEP